MGRILAIIGLLCLLWFSSRSQHQHHSTMNDSTTIMSKTDTTPKAHAMQNMMSHHMSGENMSMEMMSHSFSVNLPMSRNGSGTGWLPDASPMYGTMFHSRKWMFMLHGNLFLRYNNQDISDRGNRGGHKVDVPDWIMFMGQKKLNSRDLIHFSTMFSLDALTMKDGYPLLFQSGEDYKGQPLVDKQHPHDLFSELSISYAHAFSKKTDAFIYIGYPGEPALGPIAFMHRPSALYNPDAPLSHHWVDATHISFGVATVGIRYGKFKIEGSSFTGREPDDKRYGFDKPVFNSWSGRLSYNPSPHWALQVSHGFIKSPEALHPEEDIHRTTASAIYSTSFKNGNTLNTTLLWGMNKQKAHRGENAFMIESAYTIKRLAVYGKYEFVEKSAEELNLDESIYKHDAVFDVNAFTLGINYRLFDIGRININAGSQATLNVAANRLNNLYGKDPVGFEVYLRLSPGIVKM